jgi:translation initiation factor IF-2
MQGKSKVRIYDLARSLISESLPEKDRKNLQSVKTKQILDICEKLGYHDKTPSSSIESEQVSNILLHLNEKPLQERNSKPIENTIRDKNLKNQKSNSALVAEPPKKSRVLRRLTPELGLAEPLPPVAPDENLLQEPQAEQQKQAVVEEKVVEVVPVQSEIPEEPVQESPKEEVKVEPIIVPEPAPPVRRVQEKIQANFHLKPASAMPAPAPTPVPVQQHQPYRVAKPINTSFAALRRKPAGPPARKPNAKPPYGGRASNAIKEKAVVERVAKPTEMILTHAVTVKELAALLSVSEAEIIRNLFMKGIMRTVNQTLESDLTVQVAADLGCTIILDQPKSDQSEDLASRLKELVDHHTTDEEAASLVQRPPVVTIMGHVDHGKTTLLDSIRKAKLQITSTESGGITQHIGAYQINVVDYDNKIRKVTFLDTPGHEAFTALRARGAQVTDIAILVVAADDGVMPQTIEAISHAKAAGVPIIIAVNKIDKPDANPDRVLTQLIEHGLVVEDYGGKVVCAKISAKQNLNLDDLLTKITLVADAELGDKLLANPTSFAVGAIIEASLSPNRGPVASLLVQSGTLRKGDSIVAGTALGRVRAIFNDVGVEITEAPPATPAQILGLDVLPQAGDTFKVFKNAQEAKAFANIARDKHTETKRSNKRGLEVFSTQVREGLAKELSVIIKADAQGSAEAIANELNKLSSDQVRVRIVHSAAGAVTENDINLASATNSIVVNFNSVIDGASSRAAAEENVPIYTYNIIYQITDAVRKAINGLLEPEKVEVKHGQAEVRQIFPSGKNKIAGCYVLEGKIVRGSVAKLIRNKKEIFTARLDSLKRFKDDAKEVVEGFECGIAFDGYNDFEQGDIIESWGVEFQERSI